MGPQLKWLISLDGVLRIYIFDLTLFDYTIFWFGFNTTRLYLRKSLLYDNRKIKFSKLGKSAQSRLLTEFFKLMMMLFVKAQGHVVICNCEIELVLCKHSKIKYQPNPIQIERVKWELLLAFSTRLIMRRVQVNPIHITDSFLPDHYTAKLIISLIDILSKYLEQKI